MTELKYSQVSPELDQHTAHEVYARKPYYYSLLGAACDFSIVIFTFAGSDGAPVARCLDGVDSVVILAGQGWWLCPPVGPTILPAG